MRHEPRANAREIQPQETPGSWHSGVTPQRLNRCRFRATHAYPRFSAQRTGGSRYAAPSIAHGPARSTSTLLIAAAPPNVPAGDVHGPNLTVCILAGDPVALEDTGGLIREGQHTAGGIVRPNPAHGASAEPSGAVEEQDQARRTHTRRWYQNA